MIPDYQTLMLPLLKCLSDGKEYSVNNIIETLSNQFSLSDEEKKELLPSGQSFLFSNRVGWTRTYLKKAGLIESRKRSFIVITQKGKNILKENLPYIDVKYLEKFPEFLEFHSPKKKDSYNIKFDVSSFETIDDIF